MNYEENKIKIDDLLSSQDNILDILNTSNISQDSKISLLKDIIEKINLKNVDVSKYSPQKQEKIKNYLSIKNNISEILNEPTFDLNYKITIIKIIAKKEWSSKTNLPSLQSRIKRYIPEKNKKTP